MTDDYKKLLEPFVRVAALPWTVTTNGMKTVLEKPEMLPGYRFDLLNNMATATGPDGDRMAIVEPLVAFATLPYRIVTETLKAEALKAGQKEKWTPPVR